MQNCDCKGENSLPLLSLRQIYTVSTGRKNCEQDGRKGSILGRKLGEIDIFEHNYEDV